MAVELTPRQRQATEIRERALIVSAAAGSGKTAVLVRRVVGLITGEQPVDLNRLLILTFTNAAAGEMRTRIGKALSRELALRPGDRNLSRQLALLADCRIQTVHAFCQDLLRRHAGVLNLPGDFVLADQIQCGMLMDQAMKGTLEEAYEQGDPDFISLTENLCEERGDGRLIEAVTDLYNRLRSYPDPQGWLDQAAAQPPGHPEEAHWGRQMLQMARDRMLWAMERIGQGDGLLSQYPDIAKKYGGAFAACRTFGEDLLAATKEGWDAAAALLMSFETPAFDRGLRGADKEVTGDLKLLRDEFAATVTRIRKEYIPATGAVVRAELERTAPMTAALCRLVSNFSGHYSRLKLGKGLLDFSDLEHYALRLLRGAEGGPSDVAQELSRELAEVLVDEYQDTNDIQEEIYSLVTPQTGSLFFVGDIKQSIYRFRRANPEIFIRRYQAGVPVEQPGPQARLALNQNFRSLAGVLSLNNFIFSRIMSARFGEIDYDDDQRLYAHREGQVQSEAWMIDTSGIRQEEDEGAAQVEARLVAGRVAAMLQSDTVPEGEGRRPVRPEDMVILLSSFTSKSPVFIRALRQRGIPVSAPDKEDFFASIEIAVLLSYLRILDNPYQDIPLISVLRSPLYLLSTDQLAALRVGDRQAPLIDCVHRLAGEGDLSCARFLEDLEHLTAQAQDLPVGALLQSMVTRTGAVGIFSALDDGPARWARMERFVQMGLDFETTAAKGLYPFIRYIDRRIEQQDTEAAPARGGGVRLMSIHASKGLEFPVVFLPDLGKRFNRDDLNRPVLLSPTLGIGLRLRDHLGRTERKTCLQTAIAATLSREAGGEEMRKLYVAMTRAREKLVLILSAEGLPQKLRAWSGEVGDAIAPEFLAAQSSAAPWLCTALMTHPGAQALREQAGGVVPIARDAQAGELDCHVLHWSDVDGAAEAPLPAPVEEAQQEAEGDYSPWLEQMERVYPYAAVSALPSKLTPAGVRAAIADAGEIEETPSGTDVRLYRKTPFKSYGGMTAAQRGTAVHLFMRYADLRVCATPEGAEAQRQLLVERGRLDPQEAACVKLEEVTRFAASPAGQRASNAGHQIREYRFSALFTPHELLGNGIEEEEILLNGAIDLLLFNGDTMEIMDFKTDSVVPGAEAAAGEKHRLQLELYAKAAEKIFGGRVVRKTVVFLKTGAAVEL